MPTSLDRPGPAAAPVPADLDLARVPGHVAWVVGEPGPPGSGSALVGLAESALGLGVRWLTVQVPPAGQQPDDATVAALDGLVRAADHLDASGVRLRWWGGAGAAGSLPGRLAALASATARHDRLTLTVAGDGGGRAEIVGALVALSADGVRPDDVTEAAFAAHLRWPDLPAPDLVVVGGRTPRVPDFLLFEGAYAEYVFRPPGWVELGGDGLVSAVVEFQHRHRRYGGLGG